MIHEVKAIWKAWMREKDVPSCLWDYGLVCIAEMQSLLAQSMHQENGMET